MAVERARTPVCVSFVGRVHTGDLEAFLLPAIGLKKNVPAINIFHEAVSCARFLQVLKRGPSASPVCDFIFEAVDVGSWGFLCSVQAEKKKCFFFSYDTGTTRDYYGGP